MSDKDPWAGVRDGKYHPAELDPEVDVYLAIDVEPLLADADALLGVVRLLKIDELDPGTVYFNATDVYDALVALQEHLKK